MPVTTIIDINFHYPRRIKPLDIEERVVVPLGHKIVWRFNLAEERRFNAPFYLDLDIELYFEGRSPFSWRRKVARFVNDPRAGIKGTLELASEMAEEEGEYKYGVKVSGEGSNERIEYDEDPYLIIRRL